MTYPLVSIGMSVFNDAGTVELAIRSILNQSYEYWELIIVDDGSSDASAEIIARFKDQRIVLIADQKNLGLAVRLNQIVAIAKGKYFARMDADDLSFPERLEKQVAYLEAHPEVDLLGAAALVIDDKNELIGKFRVTQTHEDICANPWNGINLPHPSWMGKHAWFQANPYNISMRRAQDQLLLISARPVSRYACLSDNLLAYRIERVSVKSMLSKRAYYALALTKFAMINRSWPQGCLAVVRQMTKAGLELCFRLLNASFFLNRLRFAQADQQDCERWESLRTSLHIQSKGAKD